MSRCFIITACPEIYPKTAELGFTRHGFKKTRSRMVQNIAPGDLLAFYVTGKKQFAAAVRATSGVEEDHTRIWQSTKKPDELYSYRIDIEPVAVLDEADWLDAEPFHGRMGWTQKWPAEHWTLAYQGNLREIPEEDFTVLLDELKAHAKTPARS
jgi:predicted RNA-binding protein